MKNKVLPTANIGLRNVQYNLNLIEKFQENINNSKSLE